MKAVVICAYDFIEKMTGMKAINLFMIWSPVKALRDVQVISLLSLQSN